MAIRRTGQRGIAGHESLRDQMLRHQRTLDMYADLADKPHVMIEHMPPEPKHRKPRAPEAGPPAVPLEKDIQSEIIGGLQNHPMVGLVERLNSGTALEQNRDGSQRHVHFHTLYLSRGVKPAVPLRAVDIHATLRDGRRFVIEVKRPGWTKPRDTREHGQALYIAHVIECGGFGMFATSWDQVRRELEDIRYRDGSPGVPT